MTVRHTAALALAAAAALALSGCSGAGSPSGSDDEISGEITFQTWSLKNDTFTPYFTALVDDFEKANPGTSVRWVDQPADGYEAKVLQQAESGELPDVMNITGGMTYQLVQAGLIRDLEKADPEVLETFVPGGVNAYSYDDIDGVYGYPWYLGTDLNFWNTELLGKAGVGADQLPQSLGENLDLAEKVAKGKKFDLNDMRDQLEQMQNMGGLHGLMDKLPGIGKLPDEVKNQVTGKEVPRMIAIINSMTRKERRNPALLNGSRRKRVPPVACEPQVAIAMSISPARVCSMSVPLSSERTSSSTKGKRSANIANVPGI